MWGDLGSDPQCLEKLFGELTGAPMALGLPPSPQGHSEE